MPPGQTEAARAFGMSRLLAFRRITLPQVWRYALPGLGNVWLVLVKATALVSVVQLPELMRNTDIAARAAAVGRQRVGHPHVAFLVDVDAVREREQVGSHLADEVAVAVVVQQRVDVRPDAGIAAAPVDGPNIVAAFGGVDAGR